VIVATVIDLLRQLAADFAPDQDVLRGPLRLPPRETSAFALDPVDGVAAQWSAAFGRPTTAQHALALAAIRAGEAVAFVGGDPLPHEDLLLALLVQLRRANATALWIVPDAEAARRAVQIVRRLEHRAGLRWLALSDAPARPPFVQLILATIEELHARLLPFADRAWRWFWRDLRAIAVSDVERANGLLGEHARWTLRRAARLLEEKPVVLGASAPIAEPGIAFRTLFGRACRIIDATVGPPEETLLMAWRCQDRYATLEHLAKNLRERGLSVAVVGRNERDDQVLRARWNEDVATLEDDPRTAVALVSGIPHDAGARGALVRSGYRMVLMLAGDDPHEIWYVEDLQRIVEHHPMLLIADGNPFVTNYHLLAAAAEQPIAPVEVERWHVAERAEALAGKQRLRVLNDGAMQPNDGIEPGATLHAAASNDTFVDVRDPLGVVIASLRPLVADWRGLPGSTWAGDLVVAHRSGDPPLIDLAVDERRRLARAVCTYRITPRTKLDSREWSLADQRLDVTHWNVEVRQRVEALEEHVPDRTPVAPRIAVPLEGRWFGHACAIPLAVIPPVPTAAGWSIKEALLLHTCCASEDVVITFDAPTQSLWLIETAPGGTGVVAWTLQHLETLLALARDIVRGCGTNALYRVLAGWERAWLEVLIDPAAQPSAPPVAVAVQHALAPAPTVAPQPLTVSARLAAVAPPARSRVYAVLKHNEPLVPDQSAVEQPADMSSSVMSQPTVEHEASFDRVDATTKPRVQKTELSVAEDPFVPLILERATSRTYDQPVNEPSFATSDATPIQDARENKTSELRSDVPFVASPLAEDVEDATWTVEDAALAAEVEDVRWEASEPEEDIEDVRWEPNSATQLSLGEADRALPPLGHESPALNAPRPSRYERRRPDDRRPTNDGQKKLPAQRSRFERHEPNERREQSVPQERTPPARSTLPSSFGDALPQPPARSSNERPSTPPQLKREEPTEAEQPVNVGSMIARMRRLREERERQQAANITPGTTPRSVEDVPLRFRAGQHVRCVPYGEGVVQSSQVVEGREQVLVTFPELGALEVDADRNLVRLIEPPAPPPTSDD
jgi:hypothetical protein